MFLWIVVHVRWGREFRAEFFANDVDSVLYQAERAGLTVISVGPAELMREKAA